MAYTLNTGHALYGNLVELIGVQGNPADIGGYFRPDEAKVNAVMRPSATFNEALAALG